MIQTIIGNDETLIKNKLSEIIQEFETTFGSFERLDYDARMKDFDWNAIREAYDTVSLFSSRKVIVCKLNQENNFDVSLEALIKARNPEVLVVLIYPKKPILKTPVGKALKTHSKIHDVKSLNDRDQLQFVTQLCKERNINIDNDALKLLIARTNSDLNQIQKELDKCELLDMKITKQYINEHVARSLNDDIFALSNALLEKNKQQVFTVYQDFLNQKMDPLALLGLVGSSLRRLYHVCLLYENGYSTDRIAQRLDISSKQVYFLTQHRYRQSQVIGKLLYELSTLDQEVKLGKRDRFVGFELFLLNATK